MIAHRVTQIAFGTRFRCMFGQTSRQGRRTKDGRHNIHISRPGQKASAVYEIRQAALSPNCSTLYATVELVEAARGYSIFVPILLGVLCGLRRGEIAALRWRSVDLDTGTLSVVASVEQTKAGTREKETKSGRARSVALPAMLIEELRRHRAQQAEELLQLGIRVSSDSHVVAQADGSSLQPNSLTHAFTTFLADRGLRRVRLHDLRHSHATHLLAAGVHPKVASERLGHSKVGITLDLYSHVLPGMQAEAAASVNDAMQRALQKRGGKW